MGRTGSAIVGVRGLLLLLANLHALVHLVHRGGIGGEPARLAWALMGVIGAILVVSGYLLAGSAERAAPGGRGLPGRGYP